MAKREFHKGVVFMIIGFPMVKAETKFSNPIPKIGKILKASRATTQPINWGRRVGLLLVNNW